MKELEIYKQIEKITTILNRIKEDQRNEFISFHLCEINEICQNYQSNFQNLLNLYSHSNKNSEETRRILINIYVEIYYHAIHHVKELRTALKQLYIKLENDSSISKSSKAD